MKKTILSMILFACLLFTCTQNVTEPNPLSIPSPKDLVKSKSFNNFIAKSNELISVFFTKNKSLSDKDIQERNEKINYFISLSEDKLENEIEEFSKILGFNNSYEFKENHLARQKALQDLFDEFSGLYSLNEAERQKIFKEAVDFYVENKFDRTLLKGGNCESVYDAQISSNWASYFYDLGACALGGVALTFASAGLGAFAGFSCAGLATYKLDRANSLALANLNYCKTH